MFVVVFILLCTTAITHQHHGGWDGGVDGTGERLKFHKLMLAQYIIPTAKYSCFVQKKSSKTPMEKAMA